jgi:hypothetical protein
LAQLLVPTFPQPCSQGRQLLEDYAKATRNDFARNQVSVTSLRARHQPEEFVLLLHELGADETVWTGSNPNTMATGDAYASMQRLVSIRGAQIPAPYLSLCQPGDPGSSHLPHFSPGNRCQRGGRLCRRVSTGPLLEFIGGHTRHAVHGDLRSDGGQGSHYDLEKVLAASLG